MEVDVYDEHDEDGDAGGYVESEEPVPPQNELLLLSYLELTVHIIMRPTLHVQLGSSALLERNLVYGRLESA